MRQSGLDCPRKQSLVISAAIRLNPLMPTAHYSVIYKNINIPPSKFLKDVLKAGATL